MFKKEHSRRGKLISKFPYDPVHWGHPERPSGVCGRFIGVSVSEGDTQNQEVILFSFLCSEAEDSWERLHILSTVAVNSPRKTGAYLLRMLEEGPDAEWQSMASICLLGTI